MTSLQIAEFKKTLRHYIDTTELPQEVKRYVLKDLLEEQEKLVFEELKKEVMEREQEENKNEESI
ncbi:MAG: hypothetical protein J1E83_14290 [Lachnospiraceae bacterium]|nr:hypothetical protein [Lachnospiraceae bacterium]